MKGKKHRLTQATDIPLKVKETVGERDDWECIICHKRGIPCAHFIARSHLGLGVPENIVTLCSAHHDMYDQSEHRHKLKERIRAYLQSCYPDWDETKLYYHKF